MNALKTKQTKQSVRAYLASVGDKRKQDDSAVVMKIMNEITGKRARMWGDSLVGFGCYHYRYSSGHEGEWFITGFSPRKSYLTIYIMPGFSRYGNLMKVLGKYKTGKSCLYIKRLSDVDLKILKQLIAQSVIDMTGMYDCK